MQPFDHDQVEFVGGPLDGYVSDFSLPLESIVLVETLPLRETRLAVLMRLIGRMRQRSFLVAVYELQLRRDQLWYHYVHSRAAKELRLRDKAIWFLVDANGIKH